MGWNSWNHLACDVSEQLIRETADAMVASGMRDAGYQYKTCQGRPGSYGQEAQDARTFAAWGGDYVKVDWCYADTLDAVTQYTTVRDALRSANRPIVLSICEWGQNHPWSWAADVGQLWRTTTDIEDKRTSVLDNPDINSQYAHAAGPGHRNDPDMLEVGNGGMTWDEYRAHFSLWAIMAAPLMAGNDLRRMDDSTCAILLNREVIAVDQDSLGIQPRVVGRRSRDEPRTRHAPQRRGCA